MIFHGPVSEYSNKHFNNFYWVTLVTFAVPNVNKMMILGVPTYKMSVENNLVLTWHILTGRVVFASFSFVAPRIYMLSWAPNSCYSHSSVLSATVESLDANWLYMSLSALQVVQSGSLLPSLSIPIQQKWKHPTFLSHLPPLPSIVVWSQLVPVLSPFLVSVSLRCHCCSLRNQ